MNEKNKGNLILFPDLQERYLELAYQSLDRREYGSARSYFEHLLSISPRDTTAMSGLLIVYYELGLYQEAKSLAEQILDEGLGGSLVHEFQDILDTCQHLMDSVSKTEAQLRQEIIQDKLSFNPGYADKLVEMLEQGNDEAQLLAIEQLKYANEPRAIEALKQYLLIPARSPLLKTLALQALKTAGLRGCASVSKFGRRFETVIEQVPVEEEDFGWEERKVLEWIAKRTYHEDPTFISFASQLWLEYILTIYPLRPSFHFIEGWAAAVDFETGRFLSLDYDPREISGKYGVPLEAMEVCLRKIQATVQTIK